MNQGFGGRQPFSRGVLNSGKSKRGADVRSYPAVYFVRDLTGALAGCDQISTKLRYKMRNFQGTTVNTHPRPTR